MVIHTAKTKMMKLVVEIKCVGMNDDEFDKETGSSDGLQQEQVDLNYVHALNEPHFHKIHVVPILAPSDGDLIIYQAYGNLYAMTGRKAYLPEDKQILNVGVFDEDSCKEQNFVDNSQSPPQPQYETYSCELRENDAHYGYDCPPQVPFVYNHDPCFNQDFDNNFPQTSPSFPQQYLCCENCGGPHETFKCQPMNQNFYNPNSSCFDQIQPPYYPVIHHPPQETSVEIFQAKENLMKSIQTFLKKFNRISFKETPKVLSLAWEKFFEIQHAQPEDIHELLGKLLEDLQIIREELAEYINSSSWNCPTFYNDDDDEYSIQYMEYLENLSNEITPDLPNEEPNNSLSMGDEHLSTISKTKSNEVIKSNVENLVPIPSESEGISDDTYDDIDYVEASPPNSELVSLEENDNPTPDCVLKSPSPFPIPVKDSDSFFEKSDTSLSYSDNSLPEFETFSDHTKEMSSGSTTTHADNSLLEYDSFLFEI
nr:hypothetical protein [Tanacetum cinerariifolium]